MAKTTKPTPEVVKEIKREFDPTINYTANPTELFTINWNELLFNYNSLIKFTSTEDFQNKLKEAENTINLWNQRIMFEGKLKQGVAAGVIFPAEKQELKS